MLVSELQSSNALYPMLVTGSPSISFGITSSPLASPSQAIISTSVPPLIVLHSSTSSQFAAVDAVPTNGIEKITTAKIKTIEIPFFSDILTTPLLNLFNIFT